MKQFMTAQQSPVATDDGPLCAWCREVIAVARRSRRRFCSKRCRQSAFRLRRRSCRSDGPAAAPGPFIYADPPYPGTSSKYYRDEPSFAGEVDFPALIRSLEASRDARECVGWALSTSVRSLRTLLPLCPPDARVCAWVKPINPSPRTYGLHNTWEPLIVVGGRPRRPGKRDWLRAMPARREGTLPGRKPIAFCAWLFEALGMQPGDTLVDLFPGTGIVTRAWAELSSRSSATSPIGVSDEPASLTPGATSFGSERQRASSTPASATVASSAAAPSLTPGCVVRRREVADSGSVVQSSLRRPSLLEERRSQSVLCSTTPNGTRARSFAVDPQAERHARPDTRGKA